MKPSLPRTKKFTWKHLLPFGEELLNQSSIESQRDLILTTIKSWFSCEAHLWLLQHDTYEAQPLGGSDLDNLPNETSTLVQEVLRCGKTVFRPSKDNIRKIIAPLSVNNSILGFIDVDKYNGQEFSKREIELLDGLLKQSALAIRAVQKIRTDQRKFELLSLVRSVSSQIADILDLDELSRRVANLILQTFNYYYAAIFTIETGQDVLQFRASAGPIFPNTAFPKSTLETTNFSYSMLAPHIEMGKGIIGRVAKTGVEILANDVSRDPFYKSFEYLPKTQSEVALPLKVEERVLGVLDVQSDTCNAFQEMDMLVLHALADNIATAIENARLYSDVQRRAEQLTSIIEVSSAITSYLNLDELLAEVVERIHRNLNFPNVFVFTVHPGRRKIFYQTGIGRNILPIERESISFDLDDPDERIPLVARTGETVLLMNDSGESMRHPIKELSNILRSELIIPIVSGEETLGILDIVSDKANAFAEDDRNILEALAGNIATAMRNATLYRSEQWRRKAADSVREVAGLLTADAELEQVLDRILTELEHTLPCDFAAIWLLEGENTFASNEEKLNPLTLVAVHISWQPEKRGDEKGSFTPDEVIQICKGTNVSSTWLQEALVSNKPLIRTPSSPYEPLGSVLDFPENYSSIAMPLRIADHPLGILSLGHHTSGRYGHESQTMTATFASYAAVAIENTRLYEAAHDQAWISTVLLQVAEATQSINTLDELLETMARITPMLIGVNACVIFLWENSLEAFLPVSSFGLEQELDKGINNLVIFQEDSPSFNQLIQTKAPVWLSQDEFDETGEMKLFSNFLLDKNSTAIIPMIAHGEIRGAFLVDFSTPDQSGGSAEQTDRLDEKFTIIQGIAHQTALAVENLHLLKSQKEEAYVSIALLQVAQAVVSLNELKEALETIVRITPILIGVKRAVIFLWDEEQAVFRLSQSYGISRTDFNVLNEDYSPEEFPLLNSVHIHNTLVYHIFTAETESPLAWNNLTSDNFSIAKLDIFPHDDTDAINEEPENLYNNSYLSVQASLLLAYPLSVKGEFLGVMISQEMETPGELISAQSRSRRQEITIGITQQAALAIQNDKLQNEVVERERMERELQLAREIQQTFLPDHLPSHSGWDLDVLWKPAREVGGDFYDVFDLPGNRLGLVIADVADKGMPAALFMTLVRTLIRATAREELSPSAVLEIVNNLLVTDTKHGLFITVAYAVISLETGGIIYANAGHNLPLLIRHQPKQLEILETTGMALGVLEGIHIADLSTRLEQDDCLIFYTDGITEAFSPDGEMFGESRLRDLIMSGVCETAQQQLEAIDLAVQEFIGGLPSSDDITLLTVRRSGS